MWRWRVSSRTRVARKIEWSMPSATRKTKAYSGVAGSDPKPGDVVEDERRRSDRRRERDDIGEDQDHRATSDLSSSARDDG